jgi:predicted CXXCH cytochrome family protein
MNPRTASVVLWTALAATASMLFASAAVAADPEFAGSERCGKCHEDEYKTWKQSYHSKMVRTKGEAILKDVVDQWANGGPTTINLTGAAAKLDDVALVVGSKWKQRFLVKNGATGGHLFLDKQWNSVSKKWENYGNKNDWETNCGTCHSTGFRLTSYDEKKPTEQKWSMSEYNIGCESCHGPGAEHAKSKGKKPIFTFKGKSREEQTRVCGYCHIRVENELYKTAQGNPSEHLPHPQVGKTWTPGEDWTKWYPEHVVMPGIQPEDKIDVPYKGDLAGMFKLDDIAKNGGFYDSGKHHQEYQDYLQSSHYKTAKDPDKLSCSTCHSAHATESKPKLIVSKDTCKGCHDATYTVDKYMPGTGQTATGLFVRTHTFNKNQSRPPQQTVTGEPVYNKKP